MSAVVPIIVNIDVSIAKVTKSVMLMFSNRDHRYFDIRILWDHIPNLR